MSSRARLEFRILAQGLIHRFSQYVGPWTGVRLKGGQAISQL